MFQKLVVRLRSVVRHSNEVYFCCTYMVKYNPHKIAYANEKKTADFACASALSAYVKSPWKVQTLEAIILEKAKYFYKNHVAMLNSYRVKIRAIKAGIPFR